MKKNQSLLKNTLENVDINALGLYTLGELRNLQKKMRYQNFKHLLKDISEKFNFKII